MSAYDHNAFKTLIERSEDMGDGWRAVSWTLRDVVEAYAEDRPDLYETGLFEKWFWIRLTPKKRKRI